MPRLKAAAAVSVLALAYASISGVAQGQTAEPTPTASADPSATPTPTTTPTVQPSPTPTEPPEREQVDARVSLTKVRLFADALVAGRVKPSPSGIRAEVQLRRNGHTIEEDLVRLDGAGRFRTRFRISKPGTYRAHLRVTGKRIKPASDWTTTRTPSLPALSLGDEGGAVKRLEKRLRYLGYYIPRADLRFGIETGDALIAFNKVQGTARMSNATEDTWRRLADPIRPKPRVKSERHLEIDQTRQVVFIVRNNKVRWIVHTSTGAGGATHDGVYTVYRKLAGYSGGGLYYPSYWDGLRAFHGWPEVPTYPASHGCSRLPMWIAPWMFERVAIGDTVRVYH